ncbi:MAG: amidohydrolase/deacetylase family metallohydrolase [Alphaproteobacteria bacterium]|jgi:dihydroorotase
MHDLVLKGGRVIDPAQNIDRVTDVAFADGKVAAIGDGLQGRDTRYVSGKMVTPGLIDLHTHVYWGHTSIGIDPDPYALKTACTTLVDAGTAGPANFLGYRRHIVEPADVNIVSYINISFAGIFAFSNMVMVGESDDFRLLHPEACLRAIEQHRDVICGVKVRIGMTASGGKGAAPLDLALEVADAAGLPVMCHLDYPPPSRKETLARLRKGDVLTHCFRPFPGAPAHYDGRVREEVLEARERGVIFDIGHGGGSFGWKTAEDMVGNGFLPDCISSDVHTLSEDGPAYDQLVTMSKFLYLGMTPTEIIRASTEGPANAISRPELGSLAIGTQGDASVLSIEDGERALQDAKGLDRIGNQHFKAEGMVMRGSWRSTH